MSRCFPFPPPGYEKKPRPDDANLLIKEKIQEKKHKKEKDKEKKERKEKRDKERSEEKRREKKEKKHKHENKKDKDKDKEKKRSSEKKKVLVTSEHPNGGKPSPIGTEGTDFEPQFLLELEKRFRNDDGATESKMVEKIVATDQGSVSLQGKFTGSNIIVCSEAKEKLKDKTEDQRMVNGQTLKVVARGLGNGVVSSFMGEDRKKVEGGVSPVENVDEKRKERKEKKKHRHGDGKGEKHRDRDQNKQNKSKDKKGEKEKEKEEKAMEERSKEQTKQSSIDTVYIHGNGPSYLSNESNWSKGNLGKRKYPETNGVLRDNDSRSAKLPRHASSFHQVMQNGSKNDPSQTAVQFALESHVTVQDHKVNAKVSLPQSVLGNGRKLDSGHINHGIMSEQKSAVNNHKVQNSHSLTQPVRRTGRLVDSSQAAMNLTDLEPGVVINHKVNNKVSSKQPVVENQGRSDCSQSNIHTAVERQEPFCPPKVDNNKHKINGLIKIQESKRIEEKIETQKRLPHPDSGYLSQILIVDNKVSSSQPVVENQGISDSSQTNIHTAVERQGPFSPPKVDNKKHMINGLTKMKESKKRKEKVETHKRPPHPDSKYLSQILTVPEVEWSDFDDQEWLFSSGDTKAKKPRTVSSQIDETKQVWAEALRVESADVVALPYVIPY